MVDKDIKTYSQGKLCFVLTPRKVIVVTKYQKIYLQPRSHYWNRRLFLIKSLIALGEIRNLEELSSFCARGNIQWVYMSEEHYNNVMRSTE